MNYSLDLDIRIDDLPMKTKVKIDTITSTILAIYGITDIISTT